MYNVLWFLFLEPCFLVSETLLIAYIYIYIFAFFSEVILTLGSSRTVLEFLCAAKEKKRSFRVFVAEGAPRFVQLHIIF